MLPICDLDYFIIKKETHCSVMELGTQVLQSALEFAHQHMCIYV